MKSLNDNVFVLLGPVFQSFVSLTSSLRVISLIVLADSIYNILKFFAEKMWVAFALHICVSFDVDFNELLTNDIVSFEQLGPVLLFYFCSYLGCHFIIFNFSFFHFMLSLQTPFSTL